MKNNIEIIEQIEEDTEDPFWDIYVNGECVNLGDPFWEYPTKEQIKQFTEN